MDREAWHATVHGIAKTWTWLSDWTECQMSLFWLGNIFFSALSLNGCLSIIIKIDLCSEKRTACVGVYRITSATIVENFWQLPTHILCGGTYIPEDYPRFPRAAVPGLLSKGEWMTSQPCESNNWLHAWKVLCEIAFPILIICYFVVVNLWGTPSVAE